MLFPLQEIPVDSFFSKERYTGDLGAIGRGLFTKYKRIEIESLHPRQTTVDGGTLNYKLNGKGYTVPMVVITENENVLIDGHHTVVVKKLKGQKFILANCYEFNKPQ